MVLMLACGALLAGGVLLAWRWRTHTLTLPAWALVDRTSGDGTAGLPLRALAWLVNTALLGGLLLALLVVGPAGRLAMRLLAAASSDEVQGRITDAGEAVGEISVSGTIALFLFVGLPFGLVFAFLYAFAAFVLPRGVWGGALFGAAALVVLGTAVDPLRPGNHDFDILDPGWLSVPTFTVMAVLTGAVAAPFLGRIGAGMSSPRWWWSLWLAPVGIVVVAGLANSPWAVWLVALSLVLVFVTALGAPYGRRDVAWRRGRRALQLVLAAVVVVRVPAFFSAVDSIVG